MADSRPESSRPLESSRPPESSRPIGGGDIPPPTGADRPALERTRSLLRMVAHNPKDVRQSDVPYVLAVVANGVREALEAVLRVEQAGGQQLEDYLKDPVTWREETFRMRLADAEARLSEAEQLCEELGARADEYADRVMESHDRAEVAEARLSKYEQALRPLLAHPRWLSIGSSDNTVEIRVSAETFERARAALSGSAQ